jgi:membrane-associated PAP2 superfamily phosphatase
MGGRMNLRVSLGIGLASMAALTLLFWVTDLDLKGPALAYSPALPHWPWAKDWPCRLGYRFGAVPGLALVAGACAGWIASWFRPALRTLRGPCLFVIGLAALGPGLLVHGVFKNLMGRPRPYETVHFGGVQQFLRPFERGIPFHGASFMSGHAAMAFLVMVLFFVLKGWRRWAALFGGLAFGLFVGSTRVAQGDHFPSDVLLAGALDFTLAAALLLPFQRKETTLPGA